ncbi:MAG: DNA polymerase III subunit delta [Phycisphaerales bacterium]|nr:DNA polymerase III subunit delta [Phycisphaerales bacterium]
MRMAKAKGSSVGAGGGTVPETARVVILHGQERFLILQHTDELRAALNAKHGGLEVFTFDGATVKPADVLDECRSLGLMMQPKMVVVENAELMLKGGEDEEGGEGGGTSPAGAGRGRYVEKTARELFEGYAEAPEENATLVMRAATWRPGKLDKAVEKGGGVVIKCEPVGSAAAVSWCETRAKKHHGVAIEREAAELLVENVGADLGRLDSELAKLGIACSSRGEAAIGAGLVKEMVGASREEDAWSIQWAIMGGDAGAALKELRNRLDVARLSPVVISLACVDLARKLDGAVRGLAAKEHPSALAGRLKLWGPAQQAILAAAARMKATTTARLLEAAVKSDMRLKTGQGDQESIVEELTLRMTSVLGRARAGAGVGAGGSR